jgi:hypothetical protein
VLSLMFAYCLIAPLLSFDDTGTIRGTVVNGSNGNTIVAEASVILQVQQDGGLMPLAETRTDEQGRFVFSGLSLDGGALFLVGANRHEVFHPGARVRLGTQQSEAAVDVTVFDAIADPCPLVARRHHIVIRAESGLLTVTETILVSNPSTYCYVGGAEGKRPVTLRLQIPGNFEKVTFQKEFYGRRFALIDGVLMTTIPWPPGDRELTFTYVLPIEKRHLAWERPLDLTCSDVRVSITGSDAKEPHCNLSRLADEPGSEQTFGSRGESLPPGHVIRVEFGDLAVPFLSLGRWIALGVLAGLVAAATIAIVRKSATGSSAGNVEAAPRPTGRRGGRRAGIRRHATGAAKAR